MGGLHPQDEIVGAEDATVAEAAGLTAGGEHDQTGGEGSGAVGIDGDGDALFAADAVAVAG